MKLDKTLVILDLETTGTWIEKDRIIEIGMIRCNVGGAEDKYEKKVNPEMPIPKVVSDLTGITNEDVKGEPVFRNIAKEVFDFIGDADLGGFNHERFDLPLLIREFERVGIEFKLKGRSIYDAQKIFHLNEKRDLTAAYSFYCNKELEGAHSALVDVEATLAVLVSQLDRYGEGNEKIECLRKFEYKKLENFYDAGRKFRWWDGELYMMFGKYAKKASLKKVAAKDRGYLEWILSQNFSDEVKDLVEGALQGHFPQYEESVL